MPLREVFLSSNQLEFFGDTLAGWGWSEKENVIPWTMKSRVHPDFIDREKSEMILLPNFRLPLMVTAIQIG